MKRKGGKETQGGEIKREIKSLDRDYIETT